MFTGLETLGNIDRTLQQARSELREIDTRIAAVSNALAALRREAAARYRELAAARLKQIEAGDLLSAMDNADREAVHLLQQRDSEILSLDERLSGAERTRKTLENRRESTAQTVASASERLDTLEATVQTQLQDDPEHKRLAAASQDAQRHAEGAEEKARRAEQDREEKGRPYLREPLFMYLWNRGFGTSSYRASGLARTLDGWVARVCDYRRARPNYAMLLEIPKRLREHADALQHKASAAIAELEHHEKAALDAAGAQSAREALDQARLAVEEIDREIEAVGAEFRTLAARKNLFAEGRDELFLKAIETIESQMQREDIRQLQAEARLTPGPDDDRIVERIGALEEDAASMEDALSQHRGIHAARTRRLAELEQVRRRFTVNQYDDIHSTFPNGDLISAVLGDFMRGMANSQEVWRTIGRSQRPRRIGADPGFGSGVFGRPTNPWRTPTPGRMPRTVGRRSSAPSGAPNRPPFRTGGSF